MTVLPPVSAIQISRASADAKLPVQLKGSCGIQVVLVHRQISFEVQHRADDFNTFREMEAFRGRASTVPKLSFYSKEVTSNPVGGIVRECS